MIRGEPGSKTGRYVMRGGRLVKVSDRASAKPDVFVPEGGYVDENLGDSVELANGNSVWQPAHISSPEQKSRLLKQKNLVEDGGWTKPVRKKYLDVGGEKTV